ncbi:MAG: DUF1015 family protein [Actinobacteria bacterium]|nr:DUF1015 family protein [Actinomycetota bacterium]
MALLKPFRALRYDIARSGPLDRLVAPPHDVITAEERDELAASSRYNVVRLIRPDDPEEAGDVFREWNGRGILIREDEPAVWLLEETFLGPDGVVGPGGVLGPVEPGRVGVGAPPSRAAPAPPPPGAPTSRAPPPGAPASRKPGAPASRKPGAPASRAPPPGAPASRKPGAPASRAGPPGAPASRPPPMPASRMPCATCIGSAS